MLNFHVSGEFAELLVHYGKARDKKNVYDTIVAPGFDDDAREILQRKNGKCRLMKNKALSSLNTRSLDIAERITYVRGGFLVQPNYTFYLNNAADFVSTYGREVTSDQRWDILLADGICRTSNSNTITLVKDGMLIGNGVGQQSRVYGVELALRRAEQSGHDVRGAVAASDSFFPFLDGVELLVNAGVNTILTTSGSVSDQKVIDYCIQKNVALIMIPDAEGRGFFGH